MQLSATLVKGKARIKFDAPKVLEWVPVVVERLIKRNRLHAMSYEKVTNLHRFFPSFAEYLQPPPRAAILPLPRPYPRKER